MGTQPFNKKFPMPIHACTLLWEGKEKSGSVDSLLEPPPVPRSKWDDSTTPAWMKVTRQASNWSGRGAEVHLDLSATLKDMEIVSQIRSSKLVLWLACLCFWRTFGAAGLPDLHFPKRSR